MRHLSEQTFIHPHKFNADRLLHGANITLTVTFAIFLLTIVFGYVIHNHLPITAQVAAHMSMLISVGALKIAYLARLVALYQLGKFEEI